LTDSALPVLPPAYVSVLFHDPIPVREGLVEPQRENVVIAVVAAIGLFIEFGQLRRRRQIQFL